MNTNFNGLKVKSSIKRVKMILPALTEATSPFWRPIKYSLFPPLGLATLAAYLDPDVEISLQDEHVEKLDLNDNADLVVIQVYITSAYRAYRLADYYRRRGAHVALGGLHVTSLPEEAARSYAKARSTIQADDLARWAVSLVSSDATKTTDKSNVAVQ